MGDDCSFDMFMQVLLINSLKEKDSLTLKTFMGIIRDPKFGAAPTVS